MFKSLLVAGALFVGLVSNQVQAEFVYTDWKVAGDKKAMLDRETGIEWLRLPNTRNRTSAQIMAGIDVGGEFEGWRLATLAEMMLTMQNLTLRLI